MKGRYGIERNIPYNHMMNVAVCFDDNYLIQAYITLESLLRNNQEDAKDIVIYTFEDDLSKKSIEKIEKLIHSYGSKLILLKFPDEAKNTIENAPLACERITKSTWYRLLLPFTISVDKILYMDCDVLIRKNIHYFWEIDLDRSALAGILDLNSDVYAKRLNLDKYINAGVLLLNLKLIRAQFTMEQMLFNIQDYQVKYELLYADQDVINMMFAGKIYILPNEFNYQKMVNKGYSLKHKEELEEARIVHFIGDMKPWMPKYVFPYTKEYFGYLKKFMTFKEAFLFWVKKPSGIKYIVDKHRMWMN